MSDLEFTLLSLRHDYQWNAKGRTFNYASLTFKFYAINYIHADDAEMIN